MTPRGASLSAQLGVVLALVACNTPPQDAPIHSAAGGSPVSASGGGGGSAAGSGGTTAGGVAAGGMSGGGGTVAGTSGAGGAAAGGSAGAAMLYEGPFACSEYIGAYLSMEWWNAGYENDGVDNAKWQLKWHHHGHVVEWADPNSPFWLDYGDPMDDTQGSPIQSACAQGSTTPDRVVFAAIGWEWLSEDLWVTGINAVVDNIQAKYPGVKRIDLMTLVRCPDNQMCNPNENYGPGADTDVTRQDCYVPPYVDSAIAKVVAAHPSLVALGPQPEATICNPAHNGAHMTAEDNAIAAQNIATYYAAHP